MRQDADFRPLAYLVIALGVCVAFAGAVVPFYDIGHELRIPVLLAGLAPYVVYGFYTDVVRGWPLAIAGLVTLAVDLAVKIPERFVSFDGYASGLIYYVPLLLAFVLLPLWLGLAAHREGRWQGVRAEPPARETKS